jgi:peptidyl-prolyl isomerase G (cyclophilin G)
VFHTELILSSLRSSDSLTDAESESETSSDDDAQAKERKCRGPSQKTGTAS